MKRYPFEEGDIYYTIEDGTIVESVWDYISEEIHNPSTMYYTSLELAKQDPSWDKSSTSLILNHDN